MGRPKKIKNNLIYSESAKIPSDYYSNIKISPKNIPTLDAINNNKTIDRIASVEQKETAMADAGVTRLKTYKVINDLLSATKTVETLHDGQVIKTEVPDVTANAKGAELALKAFNDLKEFQAAAGVTHNKVIYQWLNAPVVNVVNASRLSDE